MLEKTILLTGGKSTIVSSEDFEYLNQWKWCLLCKSYASGGYVVRGGEMVDGKRPTILMHRVILERMGFNLDKLETDHINRNGLDNRRLNLRAVTDFENNLNRSLPKHNTSGYMGVVSDKRLKKKKWQAQIYINGKHIRLGSFFSKLEATKKYQEGRKKYFGRFAIPNIIGA